jgi:ubiquinone/menaquinone biosynthesis C-methylase UbiE
VESYDRIALPYAQHFGSELSHKPLDRALLDAFIEQVKGRGVVCDVACGPGQVARYLDDAKLPVMGIDASKAMIRHARATTTNVDYRIGDMTALDLPDASLAGMTAFYAIVHLEAERLTDVFREFRRVLAAQAPLLLSFHIGTGRLHRDEMWGEKVDLDFVFFSMDTVLTALEAAGMRIQMKMERTPYQPLEHPSQRGYVLATRSG